MKLNEVINVTEYISISYCQGDKWFSIEDKTPHYLSVNEVVIEAQHLELLIAALQQLRTKNLEGLQSTLPAK